LKDKPTLATFDDKGDKAMERLINAFGGVEMVA
jgi:hypothetical protein